MYLDRRIRNKNMAGSNSFSLTTLFVAFQRLKEDENRWLSWEWKLET